MNATVEEIFEVGTAVPAVRGALGEHALPFNSRRRFLQGSLACGAAIGSVRAEAQGHPVRLGGKIFGKVKSPAAWVASVKALGYSAAYCPLKPGAGQDEIDAYADTARKNNIIIAEVGAWSNPLSPNQEIRDKAIYKCLAGLDLADRIGANCCVNIAGSRAENKGPHADDLTEETFEMIVETTRRIIDEVKPTRTFFCLECMPSVYPDSIDSYQRLIKAIDRERFAVHLDPVNLITSHWRYYNNGQLIRRFFKELGPRIKSCHGKDIALQEGYPVHLQEVQPGLGTLDYKTYLQELRKLRDIPLMLEHLKTAEEYKAAADYIRSVGRENNIAFG
ncbi:MAG: sugar phosphate isomerase/epimerase [Kiritimatiellales bacterium]|nr:sugar phosphate isomerase/epimerase [Kiritimatiellales bacterium]